MSRSDPWRYRCPEGHASWHNRPGNKSAGNYYCESCNTEFDTLLDMKRGGSKTGVTQ